MDGKTLVYPNVSAAEIDALRVKLAANGATITPLSADDFRVSGHGVTTEAVYDPTALTLTITVISKPFYVSAGMIDSGIKTALAE